MNPEIIDGIIRLLFVLVTVSCGFMLIRKSFDSMFFIYAAQSFFLSGIAFALAFSENSRILLALGLITLVSKVVVLPLFMRRITKSMKLKRDMSFNYFSPISSILLSIVLILFVYYVISGFLRDVLQNNLSFIGATLGISIVFIGMIIMFTRSKIITKAVGYLVMENGVLLLGLFSPELPLVIEALIIIDLIMLALLAALFAYGVDSTIGEFHNKLNIFGGIFKGEDEK